jgi:hypothetical protein
MMAEEDEDESPHVNTDETDKEAQDTCPALDNDLDSEVDDFTIEKDDHVFIVMVHPVHPHHFVRASGMVSGRLVEAFAKNSKLKGFEDIVPMSLHTYADIFSEIAFDSLPERHKWDHTIELARALTWILQSLSDDLDSADRDGCFPRGSAGHWTHQTVQVTSRSPGLFHQTEGWKASLHPRLPSSKCDHQEESVSAPPH